jgi:hypothetical protein
MYRREAADIDIEVYIPFVFNPQEIAQAEWV